MNEVESVTPEHIEVVARYLMDEFGSLLEFELSNDLAKYHASAILHLLCGRT